MWSSGSRFTRYGCFGVKQGAFPHTSIAATVTSWGREIITGVTRKHIEEVQGYPVIYGDTDSVMVLLKGLTMAEGWAESIRSATDLRGLGGVARRGGGLAKPIKWVVLRQPALTQTDG